MSLDPAVSNREHERGSKLKPTKLRQAIIKLAEDLIQSLPTNRSQDQSAAAALLISVRKHITSISQQQPHNGLLGDFDLDRLGTNLWNRCTHGRRELLDNDATPTIRGLLLSAWVFAFQLLHLSQWEIKSSSGSLAYLMRIALKAARSCTEEHDMELSQIMMQQLAQYDTQAERLQQENRDDADAQECAQLRAEYYGIRAALCWRKEQYDVAEHMYTKMEALLPSLSHRSAENLAEVLFEIGCLLMAKKDFVIAVKWLGRSNDIITDKNIDQLTEDGVKLRFAVSQAHIAALLGVETAESFEKARSLVNYIETEIGSQPFVLILKLELLNKSPAETFDCEAYSEVLTEMIRSFNYAESMFNAIRKHLAKLRDKSPSLGIKLLDEFVISLLEAGFEKDASVDWYEKLVVLRVKMTTQYHESPGNLEIAKLFFARCERQLAVRGAVASQTLLWKMLDTNFSLGQFNKARDWGHLALMGVFGEAGPNNRAKIQRRLLLCNLSLNEPTAAISIYHSMSEQTQKDKKTSYIMFKAAIRNSDLELAAQCLENMSSFSDSEDFVYACVLDAQKAGDDTYVVEALKKLVQVRKIRPDGPVHLPALLRCTIRFLQKVMDGNGLVVNATAATAVHIVTMFEEAARAIERKETAADGTKLFGLRELEWFCQNTYNIAIKNAQAWDPRCLVRVLDVCVGLMEHFPEDAVSPVVDDLPLRRLFCHFVNASALTALARAQNDVENQLLDYRAVRKNVAGFEVALEACREKLELPETHYKPLLKKLQIIMVFDFESALNLGQTSELGEIIRRAAICQNGETFKAMADSLLRLHDASNITPREFCSALNLLVDELAELPDCDNIKLARYTRCVFQVLMSIDTSLAFKELRSTCEMAKRAFETTGTHWPQEELEWIAVVAFNHGIECSGLNAEDSVQPWVEIAMSLAHYNGDNGALEALMYDNYSSFRLSRQPGKD